MYKILLTALITSILWACGGTSKDTNTPTPAAPNTAVADGMDGKKLFKLNCAICHGDDGKLGANGSKDLTASQLTLEERIAMVTNGKGNMQAFKAILTAEEIKTVAEYTQTLK